MVVSAGSAAASVVIWILGVSLFGCAADAEIPEADFTLPDSILAALIVPGGEGTYSYYLVDARRTGDNYSGRFFSLRETVERPIPSGRPLEIDEITEYLSSGSAQCVAVSGGVKDGTLKLHTERLSETIGHSIHGYQWTLHFTTDSDSNEWKLVERYWHQFWDKENDVLEDPTYSSWEDEVKPVPLAPKSLDLSRWVDCTFTQD